jgi:WD40 repeat protein/tRNA A-37 threonylcarbamoyl transferase component Bud32
MHEPGQVAPDNEAADVQLWQRWRQGERPDVGEFLAGLPDLGGTEMVAVLLVDQRERWQVGERVPAESYLRRFPALESASETVVELAYGEYLLREERGERPCLDEYLWRFPCHRDRLRLQVECHQALRQDETTPSLSSAQATLPRAPAQATGTPLVPGYEILEELGRGGMGVVYKARQVKADRLVALKMILGAEQLDGSQRDRFRTEVEAIARLHHPNIVSVFEVGEHAGLPFFSLELCPAGSLDRQLGGALPPPLAAAALVQQLALAVQAAHDQGIIHRDLKPANVLLAEDGTPRVTDFGLAKKLDQSAALTQSGAILGTPSYMAPEQAEGHKETGPATDIYALGAILYECLTGRPPFKAATPLDTLRQVVCDEPVAPSRLQMNLPRDLETICLKCLNKEPHKRYRTAGDLADDLGRFRAGEPIQARPVGAVERGVKWVRRRPAVAGLLAALAALTGAALVLLTLAWQHAEVARQAEADQRRLTEEQRRKLQRLSAGLLLDRGVSLGEQKDPRGLLWLTRALEVLKEEDADLDRVIRTNLAHWSSQVHPLRFIVDRASCVTFSPDGKRVLTGGYAGIQLWDAGSGKLLGDLGEPRFVRSVAFSPDGTKIASGSDRTARLWDVKSGSLLGKPLEHAREGIDLVVFSPNGKLLATRADDTVVLWDVEAQLPVGEPLKHAGYINAVVFRPDSKALLTASRDGTARLWDSGGKPVGKTMAHDRQVLCAAFSPDGKRIATGNWREVRLWNAETAAADGQPLRHPEEVLTLAFRDRNTLLTGCRDRMARFWDIRTGQRLHAPLAHPGGLRAVVFGRDEWFLTAGDADRAVRLWRGIADTPVGAQLPHQCLTYGEVEAALSADGKTVATCIPFTAHVWERAAISAEVRPEFQGLFLSPGGQAAYSRTADGKVCTWKITASNPEPLGKLIDPGETPQPLALSRDGKTLLTSSGGNKRLRLWDTGTGAVRADFTDFPGYYGQALSDDSEQLLVGGWRTAVLYHVKEKRQHVLPHEGATRVWCAAFRPDGKVVATGGQDGVIRLWDTATGERLPQKFEHRGDVASLAFSRDGDYLLSGSYDGTARLWQVATGKPATAPLQHARAVLAVAISPDGKTLLTGVLGQLHLWDSATGKPLGITAMPRGVSPVAGVVFSADGKTCTTNFWRVHSPVPQPLKGDVARLTLWVQVLTGLELDESGTVGFLDGPTWQQRGHRLAKLGGPPLP